MMDCLDSKNGHLRVCNCENVQMEPNGPVFTRNLVYGGGGVHACCMHTLEKLFLKQEMDYCAVFFHSSMVLQKHWLATNRQG